ncbi:hypothetical protein BC936DRAFT_137657 [Jimgerdemannia flammicorona]|uniref:Uncharacterized protein n=2 Tax=Jimgerdemannia flammicorona TaxID=994334 RepID=A0A433QIJ1_9FUNG|nr:hypothetical protein BC936DRAFT_137657 [Jimgerdemannia flammicorona]RUS29579.1 hypothetical protein BC938DRAFT_480487 [Jimgerdemannia flammicorona]
MPRSIPITRGDWQRVRHRYRHNFTWIDALHIEDAESTYLTYVADRYTFSSKRWQITLRLCNWYFGPIQGPLEFAKYKLNNWFYLKSHPQLRRVLFILNYCFPTDGFLMPPENLPPPHTLIFECAVTIWRSSASLMWEDMSCRGKEAAASVPYRFEVARQYTEDVLLHNGLWRMPELLRERFDLVGTIVIGKVVGEFGRGFMMGVEVGKRQVVAMVCGGKHGLTNIHEDMTRRYSIEEMIDIIENGEVNAWHIPNHVQKIIDDWQARHRGYFGYSRIYRPREVDPWDVELRYLTEYSRHLTQKLYLYHITALWILDHADFLGITAPFSSRFTKVAETKTKYPFPEEGGYNSASSSTSSSNRDLCCLEGDSCVDLRFSYWHLSSRTYEVEQFFLSMPEERRDWGRRGYNARLKKTRTVKIRYTSNNGHTKVSGRKGGRRRSLDLEEEF